MKLHFPEGAVFSCHSCGKCCRSGFEIPVRSDKAEQIIQSDFHRGLVKEGYQPLEVLAGTYHFLGSDEEGACCYHEGDKCGLHSRYGAASKPLICQLYPFSLVPTPAGYFVSTLFSCPSVVKGEGVTLDQHQAELLDLIERGAPALPEVQEHILVTQQATITWEQYLTIEPSLTRALEDNYPVDVLLRAACLLVEAEPAKVDFAQSPSMMERAREQEWSHLVALMIGSDRNDVWERAHQVWQRKKSAKLRAQIRRYLESLIAGKLLLTGPSLVCRLLLVSASLGVILWLKGEEEEWDGPALFALLEEQLVAQSNELEEELHQLEWSLSED